MPLIHILGGGTYYDVRPHLSLAARARGTTAKTIKHLIDYWHSPLFSAKDLSPWLTLTSMGDPNSRLVTNADVAEYIDTLVKDSSTKVIFMNVAMCDFEGHVLDECSEPTLSGKDQPRLSSAEDHELRLFSAEKVLKRIRKERKDIFLVAFKTTAGASPQEQFDAGLRLLKQNSCNLVLANDYHTKLNMVVTPEEAPYHVTTDRPEALKGLVEMTGMRCGLHYTRSDVEEGPLVPWESKSVPETLRTVVNYCVDRGAYKPFLGKTAGHFAVKVGQDEFLTSRRKVNFNESLDLCRVQLEGDSRVTATGHKPSVGGQSQRIIFSRYPDMDSIVHFHCPLKSKYRNAVSVRDQRPYECGSHECGQNTADGLQPVSDGLDRSPPVMMVYLEGHGPNIVFNSEKTRAEDVIALIEEAFDLDKSTRDVPLQV